MKRKGLIAAILMALHLLVVSMALSPSLHHLLHHDADAPDHQCAATVWIDGQFDRPDAPVLNPAPAATFVATGRPEAAPALPHFLDSVHAGRAPPDA